MIFVALCQHQKMNLIHSHFKLKDGFLSSLPPISMLSPSSSLTYDVDYQKPPSSESGSGISKISPAIIFIIVILAVIFFVSGILHLFVRFLLKHRSSSSVSESNRYPEMSSSETFQRQLQQLFHLHDSGLDQAFIDALPVFLYKEIMGLKEQFDCAVCLCEFSEQDNLRLLPMCSHAFHIDCIDTWLLSNSTCPLCRGNLYTSGFDFENPIFNFENTREEDEFPSNGAVIGTHSVGKPSEREIVNDKRVFSVRLGKFKSVNGGAESGVVVEGETSSSNFNARRCYSMGSYQYVVADSELQVAFCPNRRASARVKLVKARGGGQNGNSFIDADIEGKKINARNKGESFSVSKIWQWSRKGKFPSSSEGSSSVCRE